VADCFKYGDETSGSGATELVSLMYLNGAGVASHKSV
jgi:hypothetical protein